MIRASVAAQRGFALQLLAQVIAKARSGAYEVIRVAQSLSVMIVAAIERCSPTLVF